MIVEKVDFFEIYTLSEVLNKLDLSVGKRELISIQLGLASQMHEAAGKNPLLEEYVKQIIPAISLGHCEFYFDSITRLVGFVLWANVSDKISADISQHGRGHLNSHGFSSGPNLWIIDFQVSGGALRSVLNKIAATLFGSATHVTYFRYRRRGWHIKKIYRQTAHRTS